MTEDPNKTPNSGWKGTEDALQRRTFSCRVVFYKKLCEIIIGLLAYR